MEPSLLTTDDITPKSIYLKRREVLRALGIGAASLVFGRALSEVNHGRERGLAPEGTDELGNPINPMGHAIEYNNYYDLSPNKAKVQELAQFIQTEPWTLEVGGLVTQPRSFSITDLKSEFGSQQKVCRMRCIEAWSVVLPWDGFLLRDLIDFVKPKPEAKFVRFESKLDPSQFPGQKNRKFPWPYVEALRLDEAMNPLAMMATGMYGQPLAKQSGAPIRLVVPWKYGFKSAKAVVKIELVEEQPATFWNITAPTRYGFYANVNPGVSHPRWSQASEFRLGGPNEKRPTLMFNGYEAQVAHMYEGMDLDQNF